MFGFRQSSKRLKKMAYEPEVAAMRASPNFIDMAGRRYGRLIAEDTVGRTKSRRSLWRCICDCGNETVVQGGNLVNGHTTSCGCRRIDVSSKLTLSHGKTGHPAYHVGESMRQRCANPRRSQWADYGGRGITVCDRWQTFEAFWEDMGATWAHGLSLDRIDVNGDYEPSNCRWVTQKEQCRNKRNNRLIDTPWGKVTLAEAAERSGIERQALSYRMEKEWPTEKLFSPLTRTGGLK
jgi:hypothetical protein